MSKVFSTGFNYYSKKSRLLILYTGSYRYIYTIIGDFTPKPFELFVVTNGHHMQNWFLIYIKSPSNL